MRLQAAMLSASILALGWCGAAAAQTAPAPQSGQGEEASAVDEVVITAERRSSNLQTTPIAATVLTGQALEKKGVTTVDQLQFVVPGAVINNFGQGIDFNIRGIGKAEHNTQTTTGVITYRDGVATFPGYIQGEPYFDIASIEVLRGPQGTFVGQNATGGAVFVTSNDPVIGGGDSGYLAGQVGNFNDVAAQGALNIPVSDTFAARLSFQSESRDSFWDVKGPLARGNEGVEINALRLGLLWTPTEALTVNFKTDVGRLDYGGYPSDPVNSPNDPFQITANALQMAVDTYQRSVLKVEYVFDNGVKLRSISGYQDGTTRYAADLDGTSVGVATFADDVDEVIYSQELNLISPDDQPISWVVGAYVQTDEYDFKPGKFVIGLPAGNILTEYRLEGTNPKQVSAVFGQVSFELPHNFELQVGARYSDVRSTNHVTFLQYGLPLTQDQSIKDNNVSGKVALSWTVNDHNFLYGFVATGFRAGGLNVPVGLGVPAPFDPEEVTQYEIGWKAGFLGGRIRTQIDAFYNDYKNFQVTIGYPLIPVFGFEVNNPGTTKIYGIEAQLEAVFGPLSVDAGLGWMRSSLGKFYATDPRAAAFGACDPATGPESPTCIDLEGRDQTYAPNVTFNVGGQYRFTLDNGDTITPRLNYGYVSPQWATLFQNRARGDRIEQRNMLNAQLAWTHDDIVTTLYATNLTDETYIAAINSGLRFAMPPRQFGLRVMKVF
ncbi:MAG TPA: TonB-dependent receptor [Caulobacter sp.]|nr:TonB-dependent receptor [Caulobacter sp.]